MGVSFSKSMHIAMNISYAKAIAIS